MIKLVINKKELKNIMEILETCTSCEEYKGNLQGINFRKEKNKLYLSSCDGFRLAVYEFKNIDKNENILWNDNEVNYFTMPVVKIDSKNSKENVILTYDNGNIEIKENDGKTISCKELIGKYMNILQYIDLKQIKNVENKYNTVCFNPIYLETCYKFGKINKRIEADLYFGATALSPFYMIHEDKYFNFYNMILPIRKS